MAWFRSANEPEAAPPILNRWLLLLYGALIVAAAATPALEKETATSVMAVCVFAGLGTASIVLWRRSRATEPRERRAWRFFGSGLGLVSIGIAIHSATWFLTGDVPVFGPIDLLWLGGYMIGIFGLTQLPHTAGSRWQRLRLLLDGLIGAVAVGSLVWVLALRDLAGRLGTVGVWEQFVGTAYVVLDAAVLVVLMVMVVRRSTYRFDIRLVFIGLAAIAQGAADVAFLTSGLGRSFGEAEPLYPLNILAVVMFLTTAVSVDRVPATREYADRLKTPVWVLILPYASAGLMVLLLITRLPGNALGGDDSGLLHSTLAVGLLVLTRQAVAIRENRRVIEDQQTALVASISHELRTPLTAMVGFLDLIDAGALDDEEEQREVTSIVSRQANYMARIVSDLVMLASGNAQPIELTAAPISIDELAWSAINAAAIDASGVRVDAQRGVTAFVDTGRIQQAVANLLANADRYGGDRVLVVACAEGGSLVLEVHDNGPGVPRKYELLIWEKFERGPNRLNATIPGSGIGLAVTNAIALAHGGTAGYRRSERLGGACFWIRLPGRIQSLSPPIGEPARLRVVADEDVQTA